MVGGEEPASHWGAVGKVEGGAGIDPEIPGVSDGAEDRGGSPGSVLHH